ncbi:major facilitator superfamily MFS_1 [Coriobacterium glomerans PW2]|uniref:Major facilitator superfamily MFS_1 n=1 Tax=Coriobacterium glomerans (strain ATCC 49209 / DSM 20642 / JCM 10262 / PW2) TaxID=700015 RepID=F2NBC6_CORGP|nr:MFS transporter [Coriobacterium glomerans]AEB06662.1 major facilitator superfamily MFS_1 [Coriobacterium glomerans PW2]
MAELPDVYVGKKLRRPNPWWVGVVSGMASYIDSCAIITSGTAVTIYQQVFGFTNEQFGLLSASLTFAIVIGALLGGRLSDQFGRKRVFAIADVRQRFRAW